MYSVHDLLAEGFPHSDIRGSTIARISPRLFAACHVLHRLLAPRHPPNALFSLENIPPPPARRTKPRQMKSPPPGQSAPTRSSNSTINASIYFTHTADAQPTNQHALARQSADQTSTKSRFTVSKNMPRHHPSAVPRKSLREARKPNPAKNTLHNGG